MKMRGLVFYGVPSRLIDRQSPACCEMSFFVGFIEGRSRDNFRLLYFYDGAIFPIAGLVLTLSEIQGLSEG
jgi:hypothetical protein